jgi:hypothetical protein
MVGQSREYRGRAAQDAIFSRLGTRRKALNLAAEVSDFYGEYLRYHEDSDFASSRYTINLRHEPIALRYARVQLQLGTQRTIEALTHELLHLRLSMGDYLIGERIWIPYQLSCYAGQFIGMHSIVGNLIQHELMFDRFLELGFGRSGFIAHSPLTLDYRSLAQRATPFMGYVEEIGFPWWCVEFFRHWLSERHGGGAESSAYADSALYWGSGVHPELPETANRIRELIDSREIRDAKLFPYRVNALLELMRLPKYTKWATITTDSNGKPTAKTVTETNEDDFVSAINSWYNTWSLFLKERTTDSGNRKMALYP